MTILLWLAVALFSSGLVGFLLFRNPWALGVSVMGLAMFVVVAWRGAHPEQGGEVGRPDISWPLRDRNPLDRL